MGWTTEGSEFKYRWGQEFSILHIVQTGSRAHPPGALSPGVKRLGRQAGHSPPTSAEVKKTWIYTSTPPRLHGVVLNYLNTGTTLPFPPRIYVLRQKQTFT
jgi:hypothetical protein